MQNREGSRFSLYGQKAVAQAKKDGLLIEFAQNMPIPKERKKLLAERVNSKNSNIWARYVFCEAYGIEDKELGPEWVKFSEQLRNLLTSSIITKDTQLRRYKELLASYPLNNKKMIEGLEILLWFITNKYIDRETYIAGVKEIIHTKPA